MADIVIGPKVPIPPEPEKPKAKRRIEAVGASVKLQGMGIEKVKYAVGAVKKRMSRFEPAPIPEALEALKKDDWVEAFCQELESATDEIKKRCWTFLASEQATGSQLAALASKGEYEELKRLIPTGEKIYAKLVGRSNEGD